MSAECQVEPVKKLARMPASMLPSNAHRTAPIDGCAYLGDLGVTKTGPAGYYEAARLMYLKLKSHKDVDAALASLGITVELSPVDNPTRAVNEYFADLNMTEIKPLRPGMTIPKMYAILAHSTKTGFWRYIYSAAFHFFIATYPTARIDFKVVLPDNVQVRDGLECGVMMYLLEKKHGVVIPRKMC